MKEGNIQLRIPANLGSVRLVRAAVQGICTAVPPLAAEAWRLELCVAEAVNNAVEHAYGGRSREAVEVRMRVHRDRLEIAITDRGHPLDPAVLEAKDERVFRFEDIDPDDLPEGGFGLAIIKQSMCEVLYRSSRGKNTLTLIRRFDAANLLRRAA